MKKQLFVTTLLLPLFTIAQKFTADEIKRYVHEAGTVNIMRDNWGDPAYLWQNRCCCCLGLMYAQCEDNFKGIERNYLYQLDRQSEVDGKKSLYTYIRLQLIADTADAIKEYQTAASSFKKLMDAFADGLNYYLYRHPEVKPAVFQRFERWYALIFTDGSVSATGNLRTCYFIKRMC
ncbi:MAG: penicillin acylase family protein [Mucilaginibacter sp.]